MKIIILYSGGKDSQAAMIWAVKKYGVENCEAVFCDTGWENPQTYQHIIDTTNQLKIILKILKSEKYNGMIDLAKKKKRFPSTKARFCTEELKSKPAIDYILSHIENLIIIEGIRGDESISRSKLDPECTYFKYYFKPTPSGKLHTYRKADVIEYCKKFNADKLRPLFTWTSEEVINYIKESGQDVNPLYYQGFTRVGCFPCIMSRHSELKLIYDNHREQWENLKQIEKDTGMAFFGPSKIPKWAMKNKSFATLDDVEKYLSDKNNTIDLFEGETIGCLSVYNLCE